MLGITLTVEDMINLRRLTVNNVNRICKTTKIDVKWRIITTQSLFNHNKFIFLFFSELKILIHLDLV
jgi:hypothetical protein